MICEYTGCHTHFHTMYVTLIFVIHGDDFEFYEDE